MKNGLALLLLAIFLNGCGNDDSSNELTESQQQNLQGLEQQAKQYPDSVGLQLRLANAYDSVGDNKKALAQVTKLTDKDAGNYGLWYKKGQLEESLADTTAAINSYSAALKIYNAPEAMLSLANLYAEKRNPQALTIVNLVERMGLGRETDAHCNFIAGVYHARTGNMQQALQLFDRCIANNYTYMEAYMEKGLLYFDRKDYKTALEIFRFASTVNHLYADAYYYMARCYEMMNRRDSAVLRFQQALSLDKNLTEAKKGLERLGAQ